MSGPLIQTISERGKHIYTIWSINSYILVKWIIYNKIVDYRYERKTEKVLEVSELESDWTKIVQTLEPETFGRRKENEENEYEASCKYLEGLE